MKVISKTHIGNVRASNQDSVLNEESSRLYGVADGMGGHNGGDIASQMAVLMLPRILESMMPSEENLHDGFQQVNALIFEEQKKDAVLSGMGTTLTVLWEKENSIVLGHIGDSRAYRMRKGKIEQLSTDHSVVGEMVREGLITEEQALQHPYRNVITQAVGTSESLTPDIKTIEKQKGDKFVLCSDGLYEYVSKEEMCDLLMRFSPEDAAEQMIEKALEEGGRDNVTVLIAEVAL
ncbi:MAG: Stp1/IreP family PP2C-type Ser/Thr phosphatase [Clostridia bacterium]|nr:Stp1/IreP family PP2C-type Ser/Thr phosphatase [Clostridia bacterium]